MDKQEKIQYSLTQILCDYQSILLYLTRSIDRALPFYCVAGFLPFVAQSVFDGYEFLLKNNILKSAPLTKGELERIEKMRNKSNKLYSGFAHSTFNKINDFNREEYKKFFAKHNPTHQLKLDESISNYCLWFINDTPVFNYHYLSKYVLNFEVGSYKEDITDEVKEYIVLLLKFVRGILDACKIEKPTAINEKQFALEYKEKSCDFNMAYGHPNFSIQNNPPILIAYLDIICSLNFYRVLFKQINKDEVLDFKVKYITFTYAVLSTKSILTFCQTNNYLFNFSTKIQTAVQALDKRYVKNKLRKCCMHYDYQDFNWGNDLIEETIKEIYNCDFAAFSRELDNAIEDFSTLLQCSIILKLPKDSVV